MSEQKATIDVEEVESLRWISIRLSAVVKRTEAVALRHQAENNDLIATQFEKQADEFLIELQTKMGIGSDYEPINQNNKLVFARKS